MVLSLHIRVISLGFLILWPVFLSQTIAQGACQPHKRVVKEIERTLGESLEIETVQNSAENLSTSEYLHPGDCLYRIIGQGALKGYLLSTSAKGRYDYFDYSIIYSLDKSILKVHVTVYRSAHGAAICQKNWLSQFEGYDGGSLELGSDIDAVSGGTISATSMVKDIQRCHLLISSLDAK